MPKLRRSDLGGPGVLRRRRGRGFEYRDATGAPVTDPEALSRIDALAIPPAWRRVWICPWPNGHIQAVGTDAAGRRQYLYHQEWRRARDEEKHDRALALARRLPDLRQAVRADLAQRGLDRDRVLAVALRMLDLGVFRTGGEEYVTRNGSYGLATLLREHVRVRGGVVDCEYTGKSGVRQRVRLTDPELARAVSALLRAHPDSDRLLAHRTGSGGWQEVRAADINDRLRELLGDQRGEFTGKDLRTWQATVLAAVALARAGDPPTSQRGLRRVEKAAMVEVAEHLGNTPTVARQSYVDPRVIRLFERGVTIRAALRRLGATERGELTGDELRDQVERAVLRLLTRHR